MTIHCIGSSTMLETKLMICASNVKRRVVAACSLGVLALAGACGDSAHATTPTPTSPASTVTTPADAASGVASRDVKDVPKTAASSEIFKSMNIQIATDKITKPEDQWRKELTPEQFRILREKGTERAFTGKYWNTKDDGVYRCAGCSQPLFVSDSKFDSGCGWPSFFKPAAEGVITEHVDTSHGMTRTEVTCTRCGAHLGHVFEDAPHMPTGMRYCINSVSIDLQEVKDATKQATPAADPSKPEPSKPEAAKP